MMKISSCLNFELPLKIFQLISAGSDSGHFVKKIEALGQETCSRWFTFCLCRNWTGFRSDISSDLEDLLLIFRNVFQPHADWAAAASPLAASRSGGDVSSAGLRSSLVALRPVRPSGQDLVHQQNHGGDAA
ncbi:hypothetical protein XENORESO_016891 [Xenotaenia resolanae]|uniref:Uncharacterized protein n=1 Tax=Xenotaenia resolanae TaxID=208358 RepID=A0ABV0W377_9TELE